MKIHIFGASGSGVTTTGKALAQELNTQYLDSDAYFWESTKVPFTIKRVPSERNLKIRSKLDSLEHWILGGSIFEWGENVFPDFDLIVFLWIPPDIRIERLKKREFERYGDVIYTEPDRIKQFEDFMIWASDYDANTGIASRNLKAHENWLAGITAPILKIKGDTTLSERIDLILDQIQIINKKPLS